MGSICLLLGESILPISKLKVKETFRPEFCDTPEIRLPPGLERRAVLAFSDGVNGFSNWREVERDLERKLKPQLLGLVLHLCREEAQNNFFSRIKEDELDAAIYASHLTWDLDTWKLLAFLFRTCKVWNKTLGLLGKGTLTAELWDSVKEFASRKDPYEERIVVCVRTKLKVELKQEIVVGSGSGAEIASKEPEPSTSAAAYGKDHSFVGEEAGAEAVPPLLLEYGLSHDLSCGDVDCNSKVDSKRTYRQPLEIEKLSNEPQSSFAASTSSDRMSSSRSVDSGTMSDEGREDDLLEMEAGIKVGDVSDDNDDGPPVESENSRLSEQQRQKHGLEEENEEERTNCRGFTRSGRAGSTRGKGDVKRSSARLKNKKTPILPQATTSSAHSPDSRSRSPLQFLPKPEQEEWPRDGTELEQLVAKANVGATIRLLPNTEYKLSGTLVLKAPNMRILGLDWSSIIVGADDGVPIITLQETAKDCHLSKFEVRSDQVTEEMRAGLYLYGKGTQVEKLRICDSSLFIWSSGNKFKELEVLMMGPMTNIGISLEQPKRWREVKKFKDQPDRNMFENVVIKQFKFGLYIDPWLQFNCVENLRTVNVLYGVTLDGADRNTVKNFEYVWNTKMEKVDKPEKQLGAVQILGGHRNLVEGVSCRIKGRQTDYYCVKIGEEEDSGKPDKNEVINCKGGSEKFKGVLEYKTKLVQMME